MGTTKRMQLAEADREDEVDVAAFMRANGVEIVGVDRSPMTDFLIIEVNDRLVNGRLSVVPTMTRQEAIDLIRGLGLPVTVEYAG